MGRRNRARRASGNWQESLARGGKCLYNRPDRKGSGMSGQETEKRVLEFIREHHMADGGEGVLAAVSGGADSVCLLVILKELSKRMGIRLHAFHLNHGLRGAEADRDEKAAKDLCEKLMVPYTAVKEDVRAWTHEHGMSEEEAGRHLRYLHLEETAEKYGLSRIAVAHHMDDSAETVLFHLFRGTGLKGLSGIPPVRGNIIRPLLCLRRREIEEYLRGRGIGWCDDSTNSLSEYSRNRIRNELMPWAEEKLNGQAAAHVLAAAGIAAQADAYFEALAETILSDGRSRGVPEHAVETAVLDAQPEIVRDYLIRALIGRAAGGKKDISARHVKAVLSLTGPGGGGQTDLPGGLTARRGYRYLEILAESGGDFKEDGGPLVLAPLKDGGTAAGEFPDGGGTFVMRRFAAASVPDFSRKFPKNQCTKWFDYDKIKGNVSVRRRQQGDFFLISGGKKKSLKRYLIDEKIPREERERLFLFAEGSHILWVPGHRISEYYKISETTETILEIQICKGERHG